MVDEHNRLTMVDDMKKRRTAAWVFLMPTLLLRKPPDDTVAETDTYARKRSAPAKSGKEHQRETTITTILRNRLVLAESGQWMRLLLDYEKDEQREQEARAKVGLSSAPSVGMQMAGADSTRATDDDKKWHRLSNSVLSDEVGRARQTLMDQPQVERDLATAEAIDELVCAPLAPDEEHELRKAVEKVRTAGLNISPPKMRTVKRRITALHGGAGPGPSGWRNSYVKRLGELHGGLPALTALVGSLREVAFSPPT